MNAPGSRRKDGVHELKLAFKPHRRSRPHLRHLGNAGRVAAAQVPRHQELSIAQTSQKLGGRRRKADYAGVKGNDRSGPGFFFGYGKLLLCFGPRLWALGHTIEFMGFLFSGFQGFADFPFLVFLFLTGRKRKG